MSRWDFTIPGYVTVAQHLSKLQQEGLVSHVGLTNFDMSHVKQVQEAGRVRVSANQVQVSILDQRAHRSGLLEYCRKEGIAVLAYGVLAGGFLIDAWLSQSEPCLESLATRSLVKYKLVIDEWGGWARFQDLLRAMRQVADSKTTTDRRVSVAQIAIRYVLDRMEGVTAAILGMYKRGWGEGWVRSPRNHPPLCID